MRKFLLIIFFGSLLHASGQTPMHMLIAKKATGAASLSFVSVTETVYNTTTSPKTTASISVNSGDILVAYANNGDNSEGDISISGGGLTWTQQQHVLVSNFPEVWLWTTTATSTTSITVSFTQAATASNYGGSVLVFRNSVGGVGATSQTTNASGAPSLSLTTAGNNSMVVCVSVDWNALATSRTWRTVNSVTPTSGSGETTYQQIGVSFTTYAAYWSNAGTAGANSYGLTAPTGQKYSIATVEIKK